MDKAAADKVESEIMAGRLKVHVKTTEQVEDTISGSGMSTGRGWERFPTREPDVVVVERNVEAVDTRKVYWGKELPGILRMRVIWDLSFRDLEHVYLRVEAVRVLNRMFVRWRPWRGPWSSMDGCG